MQAPSSPRLYALLKEVSRSFYLTMRILPRAIRPQIGLAYLLARATDTIADTEIIPVNQRLDALRSVRERILGRNRSPLNLEELARCQDAAPAQKVLRHCEAALHEIEYGKLTDPGQVPSSGSSAERALLERLEEIISLLTRFAPDDQRLIREVLVTITSGQELDLQRFAAASPRQVVTLQTEVELEDYIYRVAGCVGEFWTKMCRTHLFPNVELDDVHLIERGIRFGKGLQLVNILRDLPADLRAGRCYLPAERLAADRLTPGDLLDPDQVARFRPFYEAFLVRAEAHLAAGWEYTNLIPRRCLRVRLACAWPILIGAKTIAKLRQRNVLDSRERVKITRAEVRGLMIRSILSYAWPPAWDRQFVRAASN
jgi:farnesyl-diphosphate farnesyltransferase